MTMYVDQGLICPRQNMDINYDTPCQRDLGLCPSRGIHLSYHFSYENKCSDIYLELLSAVYHRRACT